MFEQIFQEQRFSRLQVTAAGGSFKVVETLACERFVPFEGFMKGLKRAGDLVEPCRTVVDRTAIMAREQK